MFGKDAKFPTIWLLLIAFGFVLFFMTESVRPYIETGETVVKNIPEVSVATLNDMMDIDGDKWLDIPIYNCTNNTVVTVNYATEFQNITLLRHHIETGAIIDVYMFDDYNFTIFNTSDEERYNACYISYSRSITGTMYGTTAHEGTHHIVFDNKHTYSLHVNSFGKRVNYNIKAIVPASVCSEFVPGDYEVRKTIFYPSFVFVGVGLLGLVWWIVTVYVRYKREKDVTTSDFESGISLTDTAERQSAR